jgi:PAS domain S-box-containing protein
MEEKDKHTIKEEHINELETAEVKNTKTDVLLSKSEEKYQTLLDTIPHGIQEIDASGSIVFVNKAYNRIYGYEEGEVIGTSIVDKLAHDPERKKLSDYLKRLVKDQPTPTPFFEEDRTKKGRIINVRVDWNYKRDDKGLVVGFVSVITDITERKQAEQKLLTYQKQLKSLASEITLSEEKERRRLADYLHDEIGQQLLGVKIKLEMLKGSLSSRQDVTALGDSITTISAVIDNTRSLTSQISPPILHQIGLEAALESLAKRTEEQYHITVTLEDDNHVKPLDDDVKILLFQAVRELLTNVAKHAQAHNARVSLKKDSNR